MLSAIDYLIPYYELSVGKTSTTSNQISTNNPEGGNTMVTYKNEHELNMILFGPPGTGKTYNTKVYAISICDKLDLEDVLKWDYNTQIVHRYNELVAEGRVVFTTFHQSYSYEEFIEGIKAITNNGNVTYEVTDGIFKSFCEKAGKPVVSSNSINISPDTNIWKFIIKEGQMNSIKQDCFDNGYIRLGWDINSEFGSKWANGMTAGDLVLIFKSKSSIDAIGIVEEDGYTELNANDYKFAKKVKWIAKNIDEDILAINGGFKLTRTTYNKLPNMKIQSVLELIKKYDSSISDIEVLEGKPYVFIIDEINRGNISKIFGELITLIEDSKRGGCNEETTATLPYSANQFTVPNNVYILGTMNTADRSISLMDTALRRRFKFIEMLPDSSVINELNAEIVTVGNKQFNVVDMLNSINSRIEVLYDREHTIGHAFFTKLKDYKQDERMPIIASIFKNKIIPLLQEYFYEDYSKIRLVLGDNGKKDVNHQFVKEIKNKRRTINP